MFHLILTLIYLIPNIYVFFRVKSLFINKGYKLWYTIIFLGLLVIFPLAETLAHRDMNSLMQILSTISGYTLPFFLYFFLSVVLFDLFLLFNMMFRIVPAERRRNFSFRIYTLSAMIVLSVVVVIAGAINLNTIRISRYQIEVPRRDSKIDHLKLAFVADFHIEQNTSPNFVKQFVRKIKALDIDLMLYGGDIIDDHRVNENINNIASAISGIKTKYGSFGVLGNHEFYRTQDQGTFFRKAGIKLLRDTVLNIESSFYLAGRYDQHFRQRKSLNDLLAVIVPDLPVILLDHRPIKLQEVSHTPVDVQLSGHTHHGQMFPLNFITNIMYELSWGYKKIKNTHFFVTSGLRLWGPPVKTAGKSEIILIDINFK